MFLAIYVERINPGEFGVAQPWYYLFTKSFWCSKAKHNVQPVDDFRLEKMHPNVHNEQIVNHWIEIDTLVQKKKPTVVIYQLNKVRTSVGAIIKLNCLFRNSAKFKLLLIYHLISIMEKYVHCWVTTAPVKQPRLFCLSVCTCWIFCGIIFIEKICFRYARAYNRQYNCEWNEQSITHRRSSEIHRLLSTIRYLDCRWKRVHWMFVFSDRYSLQWTVCSRPFGTSSKSKYQHSWDAWVIFLFINFSCAIWPHSKPKNQLKLFFNWLIWRMIVKHYQRIFLVVWSGDCQSGCPWSVIPR